VKLFRTLMSLHYTTVGAGTWSGSYQLPTFYVHAVDGEHAKGMALAVTNPDGRSVKSSGSAIAIDDSANPDESTYYSWSDL
jgi:hypothetical protein